MRKSLLALTLALLLAGCSAAPAGEASTPPTRNPGETETPGPAAEGSAVMTARLVEDGPPSSPSAWMRTPPSRWTASPPGPTI